MFCAHCLECPHAETDVERPNGVCAMCLRALHTMWTFQGPRIRNVRAYLREAFADYVVRSFELMFWTFEEQEEALLLGIGDSLSKARQGQPCTKPPPHHRL